MIATIPKVIEAFVSKVICIQFSRMYRENQESLLPRKDVTVGGIHVLDQSLVD